MSDIPKLEIGTFAAEIEYYRRLSKIFKERIASTEDYSNFVRYQLLSMVIEQMRSGLSVDDTIKLFKRGWRKYCEHQDYLFQQWKMHVAELDHKVGAAVARLIYCTMEDDTDASESFDPETLSVIDGNIRYLRNLDALVKSDQKAREV